MTLFCTGTSCIKKVTLVHAIKSLILHEIMRREVSMLRTTHRGLLEGAILMVLKQKNLCKCRAQLRNDTRGSKRKKIPFLGHFKVILPALGKISKQRCPLLPERNAWTFRKNICWAFQEGEIIYGSFIYLFFQ